MDADIIIVVGTSFSISYTVDMLLKTKEGCLIYYVDPNPDRCLKNKVEYITKNATDGIPELIEKLLENEKI
jgi:NAD-dependent deacetylase